jgi:hypothetical protein
MEVINPVKICVIIDGLPVKNSRMVDNIGASPIMNHVAGFEPNILINDQM